jgi:DNA-directed RNA polymerase specialized sigma24 family protein
MNDKDPDITILESHDMEEKIAVQHKITARLATRKFLEESCDLARLLPSKKKVLFIMHYSGGFSISEIAKLCRVDEGTVCKRLKEITNEINEMRKCCEKENYGTGAYEKAKRSLNRAILGKIRIRSARNNKNIPGPLP